MDKVFIVLQIIISVLMILVVLVQEGKDPGMRGISGSSPDAGDSFFSKNGGGTKASFMNKITAALAVLFLITTIALMFLTSK